MSTDTPIQIETEVQLPVLKIEVRGEVVTSNAAAFILAIKNWMSGINLDLKTDEDFAQAESDVKLLGEKEKAITAAKEKALADAEQINDLMKTLEGGSEEIRQARLRLERQIKTKKEEIRDEIIAEAVAKISNGHGDKYRVEIANAIKGKRSLNSIRDAVGVVVTSANALIDANRQLLAAHFEAHGNDLIPDRKALELTASPEQLTAELDCRIERQIAEAARRKAEAEAAAARAELAEQKRKADEAEAAAKKAQEAPQAAVEQVAPTQPEPAVATCTPAIEIPRPTTSPEWEEWTGFVLERLSPLKAARSLLTDPHNIARAATFADGLRELYKEMVK